MPSSDKTVADLDLNDEHITAGLEDSLQEAAKRLLTVPGGILVICLLYTSDAADE